MQLNNENVQCSTWAESPYWFSANWAKMHSALIICVGAPNPRRVLSVVQRTKWVLKGITWSYVTAIEQCYYFIACSALHALAWICTPRCMPRMSRLISCWVIHQILFLVLMLASNDGENRSIDEWFDFFPIIKHIEMAVMQMRWWVFYYIFIFIYW